MPINFDDLKSTKFDTVHGIPAWDLRDVNNEYNQLVDQVSMLNRTVQPADETAPDPEALTVGPSPFEYIAGTAEQIHIWGDAITEVAKWSESTSSWVVLTQSASVSPIMQPGSMIRVTYTGAAPTMVRDVSNFNNAAGLTEILTVTTSPVTITAPGRAMVVYVSGGLVSSITRNSIVVSQSAFFQGILPRGGAVVVTFDESDPPYVVLDS